MVKEIPLFPLNLVAFPGEELNLHIFEPRYKQLINDCLETKTTFGIPSYALTKIEYGTEMKIIEVSKAYDDGRMDIKTVGLGAFRVLEFINPWSNKLYAGGPVELLPAIDDADPTNTLKLSELCRELFSWLHMDEAISLSDTDGIYKVIHKIGLKIEEEYELLQMTRESERQAFIIGHLQRLIPALERAERAKEKIRLNGHFKHFDPLKF